MQNNCSEFEYNVHGTILTGQIYTDFFYGRPGYGQTPEADEVESVTIIALDHPISVKGTDNNTEGDYDSITEINIKHIQLIGENPADLKNLKGCGIKVTGYLCHGFNGHHHTPVLMSLTETPVKLDSRNTFENMVLSYAGSGFLLGSSGLIMTAAHVVSEAIAISITRGYLRHKASLIKKDEILDVAILKIESDSQFSDIISSREATVRPFRTRMPPKLGERVYTFGFPLNGFLPHSLNMTEGIISSELGIEPKQFQISAAIQPGNSGGPTFDKYGNLIGINISSLNHTDVQMLNFCTQSWALYFFCLENGIHVPDTENSTECIEPTLLAAYALHFCVEVECWTRVPSESTEIGVVDPDET